MVILDIVSDLYIDQWDNNIPNNYPRRGRSHFPYQFSGNSSKLLIIAGDVSNNINTSIQYMNDISEHYDKILFVEGDHEHVEQYPNLYTHDQVNEKFINFNNDKLVYLPKNDFVVDNIVFIGVSGWWNFNYKTKNNIYTNKQLNYFNNWMSGMDQDKTVLFFNNLKKRAIEEYELLKEKIIKYHADNTIKTIVIVTHTVQHDKYYNYYNSDFEINNDLMILDGLSNKIKYKIFGHTHSQFHDMIGNIHYICHPRGHQTNFNREIYNVKTIKLGS